LGRPAAKSVSWEIGWEKAARGDFLLIDRFLPLKDAKFL
jgi:hypothetical protein